MNILAGKRLQYLIGSSSEHFAGADDVVTEVPWDCNNLAGRGVSIGYCNLFDEKNEGKYGPYLADDDVSGKYNEGRINPAGRGWQRNIVDQFHRRRVAGFEFIELDNPDSYDLAPVLEAHRLAATYNLKTVAKNPLLVSDPVAYIGHPNVYGVICEQGADNPSAMAALRSQANKDAFPVWFVYHGAEQLERAKAVVTAAARYPNMGVSHSRGEYDSVRTLLIPKGVT